MESTGSKADVRLDAKPTNASVANSSFFGHSSNDHTEETGPQKLGIPSDLYYKMTGNKYLYVFNQFTYEKNEHYLKPEDLQRDGTIEDAVSLTRTFSGLGFQTKVHLDKRHEDILKEMGKVCNMDHSATSCVVVAIMTHGHNGGVLLAYDKPYNFKELTDMLQNGHPSLVGIPKLCFVQACRSGHVDSGKPVLIDSGNIVQPTHSDVLLMYSSYPHYVSIRTSNGTWMMQHLCTALENYHQNFDLGQIITIVNRAVANETCYLETERGRVRVKQIPETKSTLTKLLKL